MARQASSSIGGIAGGFVGVLIIGALIATPIYIGSLGSNRAQLSDKTADAVETVRRAVLNMDEHLVRIANLSEQTAGLGEVEGDVAIPQERLAELQRMSQSIRRTESADQERGTELADIRVPATGGASRAPAGIPGKLKAIIAEHNKLMQTANAAINNLRSISVGDLSGDRSLEGARIKAVYDYASGRISANHAAFLNWQAETAMHNASPFITQLAELKMLGQSIGMESPTAVLAAINDRVATVDSDRASAQERLDAFQATIDDYKARIEQLDSRSRMNRLQMAEMQSRSERIYDASSRYAQLAAEARDAEAQADALRYGTLQDATRGMAGPEDLVGVKYEGGSPTIGLLALEDLARNLREQIASYDAAKDAMTEQLRQFDAESASVEAAVEQAQADAHELAKAIDEVITQSESLLEESATAADEAVKRFGSAANNAMTAATAAGAWKTDMKTEQPAEGSPAAELNEFINADGHMQGSMQFLQGECAYQIATVRYELIQLAKAISDMKLRTAEITDSPAPAPVAADRIEVWRNDALAQLTKAEAAYKSAARSFPNTRATVGTRSIQGKDTVWHAQAGEAAVHLMRAALKDDATERKASKDLAYDLLQKAAEGRERSPLLTPTVDMILELQANPS
ncbi:MAG: hypothetical protein KDA33_03150 [Phycisphaerales bacterium]|nr:hypothetical protein [Phycisphaerales bacterium]